MDIDKIKYLPRVQEILADLEKIKDARAEILEAQSVSISGSHSVTKVRLEELRVAEAELKRELVIIAQNHGVVLNALGGKKRAYYDE